MLPLHDTDFYIGEDRASVLLSVVTVALVGVVGFPALVLTALARHRDAKLRAREAVEREAGADTRALRPGPTVLHGEVLGEEGALCVSIRITQSGRQYKMKSQLRHKWTETARVVDARPFLLRLASGATVRVEPHDDVLLVDWLGKEARPSESGNERVRVAELRPHEKVFIDGELVPPPPGDAYRGGESTFLLRARRGARMLISVDPLEERHETRARGHRAWAIGLAVGFTIVNGLLFGSYWRGSAFGAIETGNVVDLRMRTTSNKGHTRTHYGFFATVTGDPNPRVEEVSRYAYLEAKELREAGGVPQIPFVVVPGTDTRWVGLRPTLSIVAVMLGWIGMLFTPLAYALWVRHRRPWYERKKVVDDGEGPLGMPDKLV